MTKIRVGDEVFAHSQTEKCLEAIADSVPEAKMYADMRFCRKTGFTLRFRSEASQYSDGFGDLFSTGSASTIWLAMVDAIRNDPEVFEYLDVRIESEEKP